MNVCRIVQEEEEDAEAETGLPSYYTSTYYANGEWTTLKEEEVLQEARHWNAEEYSREHEPTLRALMGRDRETLEQIRELMRMDAAGEPMPDEWGEETSTELPLDVDSKTLLLPCLREASALSGNADAARELLLAAHAGDVETVTTLLLAARGADGVEAERTGEEDIVLANGRQREGTTPGEREQGLLEARLGGEAGGKSALHLACRRGHLEVVKLLIGAGAHVEGRDAGGKTPLMEAARKGQKEVVLALLDEYGADVEARDASGRPVLSIAILNHRSSLLEDLISRGAEVTEEIEGYARMFDEERLNDSEARAEIDAVLDRGWDENFTTFDDDAYLFESGGNPHQTPIFVTFGPMRLNL
jgi:hypothetical protein